MYKLYLLKSKKGTVSFAATKNIEEEKIIEKSIEQEFYELKRKEEVSELVYYFYLFKIDSYKGSLNYFAFKI
jgi:hypothetical protein